ncbi:TRAP transporter small permease [Leptothrix discophora]|uniref:TRAP transporter small permease protein n=1 Tax=Leptothrix discophora TaxID=89 RepID=A0ABT9G6Z8_LEPDI|nr:TRAP transporter small permease [Leptothrix discophora]MDP4302190.1 TRAP transporter small permease [Leptothrix discophora]
MQENLSSDLPPGTVLSAYGQTLRAVSKVLALLGGLVFIGLVLMSIVSIVGRKVASAPVPGDVELLQMCAAFASASFFAWCHLNHGDVKVDFFTQKLAEGTVRKLDAFGSLLVAVFGAAVAWRSAVGALNLLEYQETSPILGLPVWVAQALMVPGFVVLTLAGLYMAVRQWKGHAA